MNNFGALFGISSDFAPVGFREATQGIETDGGEHGYKYTYRTVNTVLLGWLIDTLTKNNSGEYFSDRIWSKMGAESDAHIQVSLDFSCLLTNFDPLHFCVLKQIDDLRFNFWGAGLSATLRDIARFGEVIRNDGLSAAGKQIIPKSIVRDSKDNGNASQFERSNGVSEQAGSA